MKIMNISCLVKNEIWDLVCTRSSAQLIHKNVCEAVASKLHHLYECENLLDERFLLLYKNDICKYLYRPFVYCYVSMKTAINVCKLFLTTSKCIQGGAFDDEFKKKFFHNNSSHYHAKIEYVPSGICTAGNTISGILDLCYGAVSSAYKINSFDNIEDVHITSESSLSTIKSIIDTIVSINTSLLISPDFIDSERTVNKCKLCQREQFLTGTKTVDTCVKFCSCCTYTYKGKDCSNVPHNPDTEARHILFDTTQKCLLLKRSFCPCEYHSTVFTKSIDMFLHALRQ